MGLKIHRSLGIWIVIAAVVWGVGGVDAQMAVTDGLVSFWTLDEADIEGDVVKDIVGENHGTIVGDPQVVPGKINEALEFDGASTFIDCGNDESLNLTKALTLEVWIKPAVKGEGGPNAGPLCKAQAGGSWCWQLRYNAPGGFMGFQFNAVPGGSTWISVQENLEPGEWYHITGTFDGSDIVCYLNGEEKERRSIGAINGSADHFFIGQDGWVNVFEGTIDEVRVYNRALTPVEVQQNYHSRSQLALDRHGKLAVTWGQVKRLN